VRVLLFVAGAFAFIVSFASVASAHAEVSNLTPGACSSSQPGEPIRIVFTEELVAEGSRIELVSGDVTIATAGIDLTDLDHRTLELLTPVTASGPVTVTWTAHSALDDDVTSGIYGLTVGSGDVADDCAATSSENSDSSSIPFALIGALTALGAGGLVLLSRQSHLVES